MFRMSGARPAAVAVVVLAVLAVAGCGGSDDGAAQDQPTTTATRSTPVEGTPADAGRAFTADPAIVGAHPIAFTSWTRLAADRIAINFQTGSPECYGVDVGVTETDSTVTVELRSGTRPDAVGRMCTMIAVFGTLEVPLKAPLGTRQVLSAV